MPKEKYEPVKDRAKTGSKKPANGSNCPNCGLPFNAHGAGGNCPRGIRKMRPTVKGVADHRDRTLASLALKGGGIRLV